MIDIRQVLDLYSIDPHEYQGVVLNTNEDNIPRALANEIARVGRLELWQFQSFYNHEHPHMAELDGIVGEPAVWSSWANVLAERFPDKAFVIEIYPLDRMTWYQPTINSPTSEFEDWEIYSPPKVIKSYELKQTHDTSVEGADSKQKTVTEFLAVYDSQAVRTGSNGPCERCNEEAGFTEPYLAKDHPGIKLIRCKGCDAELVHSTRAIRIKVGKGPVIGLSKR